MAKFKWDSDTLTPGIEQFGSKMDMALAGIMLYHEPRISSYMRNNAKWTDRTSNARNGLKAKAYRDGSVHGIVCFHQVPYGIWLEVRWNGKYAIIIPTIQSQGVVVMRTIADVFQRMRQNAGR